MVSLSGRLFQVNFRGWIGVAARGELNQLQVSDRSMLGVKVE